MAQPAVKPKDTEEEERALEAQNDARLTQSFTDFLRQYAPPSYNPNRDTLLTRYKIETASPLPEYNLKLARAYAVTDLNEPERRYFAHVCEPGSYQRHNVIAQLKANRHPNILPIVASGVIDLSMLGAERFVIVYERPVGKTIAELMATTEKPLSEAFIRERIVTPLVSALEHFAELKIAHGSLDPNNIYYGDSVMLGPCAAEPCGYSQPFYLEFLERMLAPPSAKGEGSVVIDYYALTLVVAYLLFGPKHFASYTPEGLIKSILKDGIYNAIIRGKDHPESMFNFFRALLAPSTDDRSNRFFKLWIEGKRYNVLTPVPPNDAQRPFESVELYAASRRELAYLVSQQWNAIIEPLQGGALIQWTSTSLRNKEMTEAVTKLSKNLRDLTTKNDHQLKELLMRLLIQLDPGGPIRIGDLTFFVDGIDSYCVDLFIHKDQANIHLLTKFIETSMVSYWTDAQRKDTPIGPIANAMLARIDRLRSYIRNPGLGFGAERMLYDLNPDLPCQSPLLDKRYVNSLPVLLKTLDSLAPRLSRETDPIDRHIAAYIASKLSMQFDVKLGELEEIPTLATHPAFYSLKFLYQAQQKAGTLTLPGLTHWVSLRILPTLQNLRSNTLRKGMKEMLVKQAQSGELAQLASTLLSEGYTARDTNGYAMAAVAYKNNIVTIEGYRTHKNIDAVSARLAYRIARTCALLALGISLYLSLQVF